MRKLRLIAMLALGFAGMATAAEACPDYSQSGTTYEFSGSDLYSPRSFNVVAGGRNSIEQCGIRPESDRGQGFVTSTPDFTFWLSGMGPYRLVISARSGCDSVLLINTGKRDWYYDDDDNGDLDPRISLGRPPNGWLDVWIGTHDGSSCDAVLTLETFNN